VHVRRHTNTDTHTGERERTFEKEYNKVTYFVIKKKIRQENNKPDESYTSIAKHC